ncbi:MAG: DUF1328 domain-containing protein [Candidatus Babeliales bacterium]
MLYYVALFFVLALVAGIFGFGGLAIAFANIAQTLFWLFLVLFGVSLLVYMFGGKPPRLN